MTEPTGDTSTLDSILKLLEQGNSLYKSQDYWKAAECFENAQEKLRNLADQATHDSINETKENALKIAQLYLEQANEYFSKAQESVLQALQQDMGQDEKRVPNVNEYPFPLFDTDAQGRGRLHLLARLFASEQLLEEFALGYGISKKPESAKPSTADSLEQRLALLNQNLPKNLLSNEQRMQQINKGLNRLGFSLYDNSHDAVDPVEIPKSYEEEVNSIINQAKEEVALLRTTEDVATDAIHPPLTTLLSTASHADCILDKDSVSESDEQSQDSDSDVQDNAVEPELTREQLESVRDKIRDKIAAASAQLAQLLVMLQPDEGGFSDIEFDPASGKSALQQARRLLNESAKEWRQPSNSSGHHTDE
jgi:hypothetical protein